MFFCNGLNAQTSLLLTSEFGKFENASAFSVTDNGFIFVADSYSNEIFKFDTLGNLIRFIGGYGWEESQFDEPADIFANTLNVYVADKNNNRIQIFDKDLNFLSDFRNQPNDENNLGFAYPTCCAVSTQGDLFVLDSDNSRILKFDLNGNFLQEIGGLDAGDFSVTAPQKFAVSNDGKIFVLDENRILAFDYYGNGLFKINTGFKAENINLSNNFLSVNNGSKVTITDLTANRTTVLTKTELNLPENVNIVEVAISNNNLYLLTLTDIKIFKFINSSPENED